MTDAIEQPRQATAWWPQRDEAQRQGCTCQWFGSGSIVTFAPDCPIATQHMYRENESPSSTQHTHH